MKTAISTFCRLIVISVLSCVISQEVFAAPPQAVIRQQNAVQIKQAIREMQLQRLEERKLANQARHKEIQQEKMMQRKKYHLEQKENARTLYNEMSMDERKALRKQIKEARESIYDQRY